MCVGDVMIQNILSTHEKPEAYMKSGAEVVMLCCGVREWDTHRVKTHIKQPNNYHQLI